MPVVTRSRSAAGARTAAGNGVRSRIATTTSAPPARPPGRRLGQVHDEPDAARSSSRSHGPCARATSCQSSSTTTWTTSSPSAPAGRRPLRGARACLPGRRTPDRHQQPAAPRDHSHPRARRAQRSCALRGEQVPDAVADHEAVLGVDAGACAAARNRCGSGLARSTRSRVMTGTSAGRSSSASAEPAVWRAPLVAMANGTLRA